MPRAPFALLAALLVLALSSLATPSSSAADTKLESGLKHLRAERWSQAVEDLEAATTLDPDDALAWFYLAYCHHNTGALELAIEAGQRAAAFPEVSATALYNLACTHSLRGELDEAAACIERSRVAGFLDVDLYESDPELAPLRAAHELVLPPRHSYTKHRGRNGVVIPYHVLLPEGFDPEAEVRVAFSFAPGAGGQRSADLCLERFWGEAPDRAGWIVVSAVAPEDGWVNHPSHHALEDLFKLLRKDYHVADERFHLVGIGAGARPASIYAGMSERYTASLTVVSGTCFGDWDERDFRGAREVPVQHIVGAEAPHLLAAAETAHAGFHEADCRSQLTVREDDGATLQSLAGGGLLELVERTSRIPEPAKR